MPAGPAGQGLGGRRAAAGGPGRRDVGEQPGRVQRQRAELEGQVGGLGAPAGHRVAAGDDHQPRAAAGLRRDPAEDARAGRVEQVGVLDERAASGRPRWPPAGRRRARAPPRCGTARRGRRPAPSSSARSRSSTAPSSGSRGVRSGASRSTSSRTRRGGHGPVPHPGDAERPRQQAPRRAVRREQAAAVGGGGEDQEVLRAGGELADQSRLADPGLARRSRRRRRHRRSRRGPPSRSSAAVSSASSRSRPTITVVVGGASAVPGVTDHHGDHRPGHALEGQRGTGLERRRPGGRARRRRPAPAPRRARARAASRAARFTAFPFTE